MVFLLLNNMSIAMLVAEYVLFISPVWVGCLKIEIGRGINHSDGHQNEFIDLKTTIND